jgi:hypothetical protein
VCLHYFRHRRQSWHSTGPMHTRDIHLNFTLWFFNQNLCEPFSLMLCFHGLVIYVLFSEYGFTASKILSLPHGGSVDLTPHRAASHTPTQFRNGEARGHYAGSSNLDWHSFHCWVAYTTGWRVCQQTTPPYRADELWEHHIKKQFRCHRAACW